MTVHIVDSNRCWNAWHFKQMKRKTTPRKSIEWESARKKKRNEQKQKCHNRTQSYATSYRARLNVFTMFGTCKLWTLLYGIRWLQKHQGKIDIHTKTYTEKKKKKKKNIITQNELRPSKSYLVVVVAAFYYYCYYYRI